MRDLTITLNEWREECGLQPASAGSLKCCSDLFEKYWSVPGQELPCPPVWIVLVECMGLLLAISEDEHPEWEQNDNISRRSRYYPTMRLFRLHCYTAVRKLEKVSSIKSPQAVNEAVTLFTTPKKNKDGSTVILSPETVTACGADAVALFLHVEKVIFKYKCARNLIKSARFDFVLESEFKHLRNLKNSYRQLSDATTTLHKCQLRLIPFRTSFDAASHTLKDINLSEVVPMIPLDYDLRNMLETEGHLLPNQLIAVGILQVAVSLVLELDLLVDEHESVPMMVTRPPIRLPTVRDTAYWSSLEGLQGRDLLLKMPPFLDNEAPTWGDLINTVAHEGRIRDKYFAYRPVHEELSLKSAVLRKVISVWKTEIGAYLPVWQQRKWRGLMSVHDTEHEYRHLIRVILWVNAALDEADMLRENKLTADQEASISSNIGCHKTQLHRQQVAVAEAIKEQFSSCEKEEDEKSCVEMRVMENKKKEVSISLLGNDTEILVALHPKGKTKQKKLPSLLTESGGKKMLVPDEDDDEPVVPALHSSECCSSRRAEKIFQQLDVDDTGYLTRDVVEAFYHQHAFDDPALSETLFSKALKPRASRASNRYTMKDLDTLLLAITKR